MAGTKISDALDKINESVSQTGDATVKSVEATGTMGIKGVLWNNIAQLTATTILSGAFLYLGREFIVQSREKDLMFREELKAQRTSFADEMKAQRVAQESHREKTEIVHGKSMEKMGATIERAVDAMDRTGTKIEDAVRELRATSLKIGPAVVPPRD